VTDIDQEITLRLPITAVGVLESSEGGFNIPRIFPKDVPAMTAGAELIAGPWNGGRI